MINPGELATSAGVIPIIGNSLVWGDFNGDTFGDLAIEVRNLRLPGSLANAAVIVVFGGIATVQPPRLDGLDPIDRATQIFDTLTQTDVVLAAGDFNGDGIHDLVIGSPRETVGGASQAGRIAIAVGTDDRDNTLTQVVTLDRGASAIADNRFGASLAPGDFNGSGQDDLAVGEPGADVAGFNDAGRVHIFLGSDPDGILPGASSQSFSQSGAATPGEPETGDRFAEALAAADLNLDGFEDLAVGVPFENLTADGANRSDAGAVNVFFGTGASLSTAGAQFWDQDTVQNGVAIGGRVEAGDRFGSAISAWRGRLNIGVPLEDIDVEGTNVVDAGSVNILFASSNLSGVSFGAVGNLSKGQDGSIGAQDAFGTVVY